MEIPSSLSNIRFRLCEPVFELAIVFKTRASMITSVPSLKTMPQWKKKKHLPSSKSSKILEAIVEMRYVLHKYNTICAADLRRSDKFNRKTSMFRPNVPRATSTRSTTTPSRESHPFPATRFPRAAHPWYTTVVSAILTATCSHPGVTRGQHRILHRAAATSRRKDFFAQAQQCHMTYASYLSAWP